ncbi:MAG: YidH family protein [Jiangellaceae bacterium]
MTDRRESGEPAPRWPRSVYDVGNDPDPRFTLANERTFLAWIRTALALMAAGVALEALEIPANEPTRLVLVVALAALGALSSGVAFVRWARAERALRQSRPLPAPALAPVLAFGLALAAVVVVIAVLVE